MSGTLGPNSAPVAVKTEPTIIPTVTEPISSSVKEQKEIADTEFGESLNASLLEFFANDQQVPERGNPVKSSPIRQSGCSSNTVRQETKKAADMSETNQAKPGAEDVANASQTSIISECGSTNQSLNESVASVDSCPQYLHQELLCGVCANLAVDAVESLCCGNIFCFRCLTALTEKTCPKCSAVSKRYKPSAVARRIISHIPMPCPHGCETTTSRADLPEHLYVCKSRIVKCDSQECNFEGRLDDYLQHITTAHRRRLLQNTATWLNELGVVKREKMDDMAFCPVESCSERVSKTEVKKHIADTHKDALNDDSKLCGLCSDFHGDRRELRQHLIAQHREELCRSDSDVKLFAIDGAKDVQLTNDRGVSVQMSPINGKFYCNTDTCIPKKSGTGARCEPARGLNCTSCMKLDCLFRGLGGSGRLVNSEGATSHPLWCTHELNCKGKSRQFCRELICGTMPMFSCGRFTVRGGEAGKGRTCTSDDPCRACKAICRASEYTYEMTNQDGDQYGANRQSSGSTSENGTDDKVRKRKRSNSKNETKGEGKKRSSDAGETTSVRNEDSDVVEMPTPSTSTEVLTISDTEDENEGDEHKMENVSKSEDGKRSKPRTDKKVTFAVSFELPDKEDDSAISVAKRKKKWPSKKESRKERKRKKEAEKWCIDRSKQDIHE